MIATILLLTIATLVWFLGPRRAREPGFRFVYVNMDGSVRELSSEEQAYLSEEFSGADGGRPYIKWSYESRDGWGTRAGFLERRRVPFWVKILPVNPSYDAAAKELSEGRLDSMMRAEGHIAVNNPDGSVTYLPNPEIPHKKRMELARNWYLEDQRRHEELAKL